MAAGATALLQTAPITIAGTYTFTVGGLASTVGGFTLLANLNSNIEAEGKTWSAEEEAAFKQPILDQYEHQGHPYFASARLWDDGVIDPRDTRTVLGICLSVIENKPIVGTDRFGVFRP